MQDTQREVENPYLTIARNLEVFHQGELKIIEGILEDYKNAKDGYVIIDELQEDKVVGFVIFGRIPLTVDGWDIYWLAVDKAYQGKGIGKKLLKDVEEHILKEDPQANIRVETSTLKEYAHARNLYYKAGFQEVGRIKDFYASGDDVIIFYKQIARN